MCDNPLCMHPKKHLALSGSCKVSKPRPCSRQNCEHCKPVSCDECGMICEVGISSYFHGAHTNQRGKTASFGRYGSIYGAIADWDEVNGRHLCGFCHKIETLQERTSGVNPSFEPRKCRGTHKKYTTEQKIWVVTQNAMRSDFKYGSTKWREYTHKRIGERFATVFTGCEALRANQVKKLVQYNKQRILQPTTPPSI